MRAARGLDRRLPSARINLNKAELTRITGCFSAYLFRLFQALKNETARSKTARSKTARSKNEDRLPTRSFFGRRYFWRFSLTKPPVLLGVSKKTLVNKNLVL